MTAPPFYLEGPNHGRPTLLLLHGLGMGHRMWTPQIDALKESFHVIAPDLPGLARSKPAGPFSVTRSAAVISALIRDIGNYPVHIVGLSLGAMVGLQIALDVGPADIGSLLLSGGQLRPSRVLMALQMAVLGLTPRVRLVSMMASSMADADEWIVSAAREDASLTGKDGFVSAMKSASKVDFRSTLSGMRVPTTVACGANDRPNLPASRKMASEIPNATLEIIPNAGHVWNLEMPERFNDLIREVASAGLSGD